MSLERDHAHLGDCDSCGTDDVTVTEVRRVYVTPGSWDTEAKVSPAADTERWCETCQLHYPHQPPEGESAA